LLRGKDKCQKGVIEALKEKIADRKRKFNSCKNQLEQLHGENDNLKDQMKKKQHPEL